MRTFWLTPFVAVSVLVAGCASVDEPSVEATTLANSDPGVTAAPSTAASSTAAPAAQEESSTSTTDASLTRPPPECTVLSDGAVDFGSGPWNVVNDDVMGGRSEGDVSYVDGRLVFEGVINTNGGGFSSLRLPVALGSLASARSIVMRAISDGRSYMLTLDDQLEGRSQRVSHRADIELPATVDRAEASIVTIPIDAFSPAVFGQAVDDVPVQVDVVDEVGLMISDGQNGPFRLEVEWLAGCP